MMQTALEKRILKNKYLVHPENGIFFSTTERKELASRDRTWRGLTCTLPGERRPSEGYVLYDSNSVTVWKRQKYGDRKRSVVARVRGGAMQRWSAEEF